MAILKGRFCISLLFFLIHIPHVQAQLSPIVSNVEPTSAIVSWTSSESISVTVTLTNDSKTQRWTNNNEPKRALEDLKEFTNYKVCVFQTQYINQSNQMLGEEECIDFQTPLGARTKAAFFCAGYLILSFCIVTMLDFIWGSVSVNTDQQKQEELLEKGNEIFKTRRKARRRAKKQLAADKKAKGKAGRKRTSVMSEASEAPTIVAGVQFAADEKVKEEVGRNRMSIMSDASEAPTSVAGEEFYLDGDAVM